MESQIYTLSLFIKETCCQYRPAHDNCTVKPVLSGQLKIDSTKALMENGSLMKDESIAECFWCSFLVAKTGFIVSFKTRRKS